MSTRSGARAVTLLALPLGAILAGPAVAAPEGEMTWAGHVSLAPTWFDPAETRRGVRFHNGDPVTAEDVKFSLERYRGGAASTRKERVAGVDVLDPLRVRIRLKQPWPDFMTFYARRPRARPGSCPSATSSAWARTASRSFPSAPGPIASCRSIPGSNWCWRPTRATGARRPA